MEQRHKEKKPHPLRKKAMHLLESGKWSAKRMLLSKKKRKELDNALLTAALLGDNDKILRLIKRGADITAKDDNGWTPLHYASSKGNTQTCTMLMEEYAKTGENVQNLITAKDAYGDTALHRAVEGAHTQTCILLIYKYAESGGDIEKAINMENREWTALMMVANRRLSQTVKFLRSMLPLRDLIGNEILISFMKSFGECIAV